MNSHNNLKNDPSNDQKNFASSGHKASTKKEKSNVSGKTKWLIGGLIVLAVLFIAVIVILLIFAPSKHTKLQDNSYLLYTDANGAYHILSNGKTVEAAFDGDVSLVPSKDYSFAYVFEKSSGDDAIKMYILKGTSLKQIEVRPDEIPDRAALAEYNPGIVYEKDDRVHYISDNYFGVLSSDAKNASNFVISKNAKVVVFNEYLAEEDKTVLKYFSGGVTETITLNNEFEPVAVSKDGKYSYALLTEKNIFGYIEVDPENPQTPVANGIITTEKSNGAFVAITGMNADGTEIIFCTEGTNGNTSFRYKVSAKALEPIAEGIFRPISADSYIVEPYTFMNTYFECEKLALSTDDDDDDGFKTIVSTYYLDSNGAHEVSKTTGAFSPDQKYFYYMDIPENAKYGNLYQIDLGNKEFTAEKIMNDISDFRVVDKGHLYIISKSKKNETTGEIGYFDPFSKKYEPISSSADLASITMSANSIYFLDHSNAEAPVLCVSTNGSGKISAEFNNADLTNPANIVMFTRNVGYAILGTSDGNANIYYTGNGKNFDFVGTSNADLLDFKLETDRTPVKSPSEDDE